MSNGYLKLGNVFRLRRAGDTLGKVKDVATALALAGRLTPLSAIGIAAHLAGFVVSLCSRDMAEVARGWTRLTIAPELHRILRTAIAPHVRHQADTWVHAEIGGLGVLADMGPEHIAGTFYTDADPAPLLTHLRDEVWRQAGLRARLAPFGRWGESVDVLPSLEPPDIDSTAARLAWASIGPMLAGGEPQGVLLDGVPRTGKSTIARRLVSLYEAQLSRPARVLRFAVADFCLLSPSLVEEAASLLRPDVMVLDDLDRIGFADQVLGLFERLRLYVPLVVASSNNATKLPVALRLPGRFDLVLEVKCAGAELAQSVAGLTWERLTIDQQTLAAGWPVSLVRALRRRIELLPVCDIAAAVAELESRAVEALRPPTSPTTPSDSPVPMGATIKA